MPLDDVLAHVVSPHAAMLQSKRVMLNLLAFNDCAADVCAQVRELRERTAVLPDDYWVVLVGDMITEEALPTYMAMLNTLDGVRDETGAAQVSLHISEN